MPIVRADNYPSSVFWRGLHWKPVGHLCLSALSLIGLDWTLYLGFSSLIAKFSSALAKYAGLRRLISIRLTPQLEKLNERNRRCGLADRPT